MKIKAIIIFCIFVISALFFLQWKNCIFDTKFFFSSLDLKLQVIFDIRSNQTTIPLVAKIFHNKIVQGSIDIFNAYLQFFDIRFLLFIFSPLTIFGIVLRLYYLVKEKILLNPLEKTLRIAVFFIPLFLVFRILPMYPLGLLILLIPFITLSMNGFFLFSKKQKKWWIYFSFILVFSLWLFFFLPTFMINFCHA